MSVIKDTYFLFLFFRLALKNRAYLMSSVHHMGNNASDETLLGIITLIFRRIQNSLIILPVLKMCPEPFTERQFHDILVPFLSSNTIRILLLM